jgi:catalase (peroxidase I)
MIFRMGRKDIETEGEASTALVVAEDKHENAVIVSKFKKMDLSSEEYVALMGQYTLGFASEDNLTKKGRWTMNPHVFDNTYFKEVLLGHNSKYLKTEADLALLSNPEHKKWVEAFAEDQNLFFEHYSKAHTKISEMGHDNLMSEIDES